MATSASFEAAKNRLLSARKALDARLSAVAEADAYTVSVELRAIQADSDLRKALAKKPRDANARKEISAAEAAVSKAEGAKALPVSLKKRTADSFSLYRKEMLAYREAVSRAPPAVAMELKKLEKHLFGREMSD